MSFSDPSQLTDPHLHRFGGIARLYGQQGLLDLANAHFAVVGIGGVGTWVAEALARSGVGEISLFDLDDICASNTNRQVHALNSTVGQQKTHVMAARMRDINPELNVHAVENFISVNNTAELITKDFDFVIDAIDSAKSKTQLIAHCRRQKIPMVTIGSAGGQLDPTQITHCDLAKTTHDPLLARVRNNLRRLHGFHRNPKKVFSVEAIYSTEQLTYPDASGGTCKHKGHLEGGTNLDCGGGFGAATMVTGSFGFVAVSRAIKKYLQRCERQREAEQSD